MCRLVLKPLERGCRDSANKIMKILCPTYNRSRDVAGTVDKRRGATLSLHGSG